MDTESVARELAGRLEGGRQQSTRQTGFGRRVQGRRGGFALTIEFWKGNDTSHWFVSARSKGTPLLLTAQARSFTDAGPIARGAVIEVKTGDTTFDEAWLVEAAPAETARRVLDAPLREQLQRFDAVLSVEAGEIILAAPASKIVTPDVAELDSAADLVVAVAQRLAQRGERRPGDEAEIAALRAKRDNYWARASWVGRTALIVLCVVLTAAFLSYVYYGLGIDALITG